VAQLALILHALGYYRAHTAGLDAANAPRRYSPELADAVDRFHAGDGRIDIGVFQSVSNVILPVVVRRLRDERGRAVDSVRLCAALAELLMEGRPDAAVVVLVRPVQRDGETGQQAMADVAISPEDPESVLITTEDGPALSADCGGHFEVLDGAPVVMLVDWPQPDQLVGVGPEGDVHRSADGGETWEEGADLGERPQAMTVAPDGDVYVALERSIVASADGGQTFSEFYSW
jgi:hypothetical protein